jgi:hypothetical protein
MVSLAVLKKWYGICYHFTYLTAFCFNLYTTKNIICNRRVLQITRIVSSNSVSFSEMKLDMMGGGLTLSEDFGVVM